MRWFKHLCGARNDERLARFMDTAKDPAHAYYIFFSLLEIIGSEVDGRSEVCGGTWSRSRWGRALDWHVNRVGSYLRLAADCGLIKLQEAGTDWTVEIPNILKYRDEYSRKSGQARESSRTRSGPTPVGRAEQNRYRAEQSAREPPASHAGSAGAPAELGKADKAKPQGGMPEDWLDWALDNTKCPPVEIPNQYHAFVAKTGSADFSRWCGWIRGWRPGKSNGSAATAGVNLAMASGVRQREDDLIAMAKQFGVDVVGKETAQIAAEVAQRRMSVGRDRGKGER